jgi:hypothetical protein
MFRVHGSHVVHPVYIRYNLIKGQRFSVFLKTAMKVPNVWIYFNYKLSLQLYLKAQNTVGRRVLRTQVYNRISLQ